MPLHEAVVINCENGTTAENQGSGVKYMGKGVILMTVCVCICVCVCVCARARDSPNLMIIITSTFRNTSNYME